MDCRQIITYLSFALGVMACTGPEARQKTWRHEKSDELTHPNASLTKKLKREGDFLRGRLLETPTSQDPFEQPDSLWLRITLGSVYESLLTIKAPTFDESPSYSMGLASSVEWRDKELVVTLNKGATFSDGTKLNASHVKSSIKRGRDPSTFFGLSLQDIKYVFIENDHVLKIGLKRVNGYVLSTLARLPIVKTSDEMVTGLGGREHLLGTGPFLQKSFGPKEFVFHKRADYWGEAPGLDGLVFKVVPNAVEALRQLRAGDLDWLPFLIADHVPQELERKEITKNFRLIKGSQSRLDFAMVAHQKSKFEDKRLRQALFWLISRNYLATLKPNYSEGASTVFWPGGPGDANEASKSLDHGEDHAKALLDEAGWRDDDGDGVRQRGAERLMITVLVSDHSNSARDGIVASLRKNGFVVDLRESADLKGVEDIDKDDFDLAFWQWSGFADRDFSHLLESGGTANSTGYSSNRVDKILRKLRHAKTPAERSAHASEFNERFSEELPFIPLFKEIELGLIHKKFRSVSEWDGFLDWPRVKIKQSY